MIFASGIDFRGFFFDRKGFGKDSGWLGSSDEDLMFQSSRKTMKWSSLLKDIKEKVGLTHPSPDRERVFVASGPGDAISRAPDPTPSLEDLSHASSPARSVLFSCLIAQRFHFDGLYLHFDIGSRSSSLADLLIERIWIGF